MKIALFALFMMLSPNFGNAGDNVEHPKQWQYQPSLEVPAEIPSGRCIRAVYGPELESERGPWAEEWDAPISDQTREWFYRMRKDRKLVLEFCDHQHST
jgi:hypothetical protein